MIDSGNTQNLAILVWGGVLPLDQLDKDQIDSYLKSRDPLKFHPKYNILEARVHVAGLESTLKNQWPSVDSR